LDIVTNVGVLLGNGDGTFQPAIPLATGGTSVTLGQLRPGGPLDVITTTPDSEGSGTVNVLLGNGDGTFRPPVRYDLDAGESPVALAVSDFAGRGIPDLVTANVGDQFHPDTFSVLAGNGDGTFQTAVTHTLPRTGRPPSSLAVGDFTGNGHLSIALGTSPGGPTVVLGNGDGTFQDPVFVPVDPNLRFTSVLARDLAGTGRLDLVMAFNDLPDGFNGVSVLRGNGDGTFWPATNYSLGNQVPRAVVAGRFRPGGPIDLVTVNNGSNSVSVLPGVGDGTFGPPAQYKAGSSVPWAVAAADFAGRGTDDLVATMPNLFSGASTVNVLLNGGDGTFPPLDPIHFGQGNISVATGDFRGIGVQDLVTTNQFSDTVNVFLGNGDGTFAPPHSFPAASSPIGIVMGDFNGDGRLDLVVIAPSGGTTLQLLLGNGDGTFQAPRSIPAGGIAGSIAAGHFHDPSILDLVTADFRHNQVNVLLGNGDGSFQAPVSYAVGNDPLSVAVGDFRANGITDLVVANPQDNTVGVLLGNGDGTFGSAVNYSISDDPHVANFPRFVTVGNLRSNGPLDIVTTNVGSSNVTVLLGNGDGTFGAPVHLDGGGGADGAAIGVFNGDGIPDLVVINNATGTVSLLPGNGDGTFRPRVQFAVGARPRALAVGDFNGDNLPDVAVLNDPPPNSNDASISMLLNDGRPSDARAGRGAFSNGSIPFASKYSSSRGRIDPGVFSLLPSSATIQGGSGDNILIGGTTQRDTDPIALTAIMAEWTRPDATYGERVDHLLNGGGMNGAYLRNASTVTGNGAGNTLLGGSGLNLYFGNLDLDQTDWDPQTETFVSV
jgi:hypothetical protein